MMLLAECTVCDKRITFIECPTGGWWSHIIHQMDNHDAISPVEIHEEIDGNGVWHITKDILK